jgi:hypothetical protein
MKIRMIPLNTLVSSPANVRKTGATNGIAELARSIEAHGLLQNLQVRETASRLLKIPQIDDDVLLSDWDIQSSRRYSACFHALNRPRRRRGRSSGRLIPWPTTQAFGSDCKLWS